MKCKWKLPLWGTGTGNATAPNRLCLARNNWQSRHGGTTHLRSFHQQKWTLTMFSLWWSMPFRSCRPVLRCWMCTLTCTLQGLQAATTMNTTFGVGVEHVHISAGLPFFWVKFHGIFINFLTYLVLARTLPSFLDLSRHFHSQCTWAT